jgi:hypothetical protein
MKEMKMPIRMGLAVLMVSLTSAASAVSMPVKGKMESDPPAQLCQWIKRGNDIPVPYKEINQRVELADKAQYALEGRVRYVKDQPYLEVDLEKHPWLGKDILKENPAYPILADQVDWKPYENTTVRVVVQAVGQITINPRTKEPQYEIWVDPLVY